jgi:hypothetical protein
MGARQVGRCRAGTAHPIEAPLVGDGIHTTAARPATRFKVETARPTKVQLVPVTAIIGGN